MFLRSLSAALIDYSKYVLSIKLMISQALHGQWLFMSGFGHFDITWQNLINHYSVNPSSRMKIGSLIFSEHC